MAAMRWTGKSQLASIAFVVGTSCVLVGCNKTSSSSASSTSGGAAGAAAASGSAAAPAIPAGAAKALAGATGAGDPLDVSKQCAAIKPADVQALMKATVTPVVVDPGECSFYGGEFKVDIYFNDPTQQYYQNKIGATGTTPLPGVGDQAQWSQPVPGMTIPYIEAHKGSTTCVTESGEVSDTTIPYTGSDPFFTILPSDAAAYAAKEGVVCNEVFAVS